MGPNRARKTPKMEGEAEALSQLAQKPHFQRQFTFVDANDHGPETARIANSHAMREWKRAKKWRDRHMPPKPDGHRKVGPLEWRKKDIEPGPQNENESHSGRSGEDGVLPVYHEDGSAVSTSQCFLGHRGCEGRKCFLASFSPQETSLNADTIDPFHSVFPIQLDSKMRSLVHYRE
jgi:hypothetical protein